MAPTVIEAAPAPAGAEKRGIGRLFLGIVLWPRSTFVYLRDHGGRSWLWPVLLVALLALAARVVAIPIEKAQAEAAMAKIQEELNAKGQNNGGKGSVFINAGPGVVPGLIGTNGATSNPLLAYGLAVVGVAWDWLFRGAVLLGLAWLLGGRPGAGAMFRMSGWTLLPNAARLLVALAVMLVAHREPVAGLEGLGPTPNNVVISSDSPPDGTGDADGVQFGPGDKLAGPKFLPELRLALLRALDLYTAWSLVLMLIGVAVTARLGWLKSAISTAGYWALSLVLATVPPLLSFVLLNLAGQGRIGGP